MSNQKRAFGGQRNTFSGRSSQTNIASHGSVAGNGNRVSGGDGDGRWPFRQSGTLINGYPIDPRFQKYGKMEARDGQCKIDGKFCRIKEIGGKKMWTLDGVDGTPEPSREPIDLSSSSSDKDSESSFSGDSTSSSESTCSSSSSDSNSKGRRKRRKTTKTSKAKRKPAAFTRLSITAVTPTKSTASREESEKASKLGALD